MTSIRTELQQRAQSTLLQYAIFRWESAVVLALAIILTFLLPRPFFWWPRFGWPLLGFIALVVIVYSSLTDVDANSKILVSLFQEQFNPRVLSDSSLRAKVESALEYQRRIEAQIRQQDQGLIHDRLEDTANQITDWVSNIYQLALRLDAYYQDDLLERERQSLPNEIDQLNARRRVESNAAVKQSLDEVLASKGGLWKTLRDLDAKMKQASLQLDQSLTALGTIYSQVHLIDAQSIGKGSAERLQADIKEQVARLNDLVSSINDVYNYHTKGLN